MLQTRFHKSPVKRRRTPRSLDQCLGYRHFRKIPQPANFTRLWWRSGPLCLPHPRVCGTIAPAFSGPRGKALRAPRRLSRLCDVLIRLPSPDCGGKENQNAAENGKEHSAAQPQPQRSATSPRSQRHIGAGAHEFSCAFAGGKRLQAGTARAPKPSRRGRNLQSCNREAEADGGAANRPARTPRPPAPPTVSPKPAAPSPGTSEPGPTASSPGHPPDCCRCPRPPRHPCRPSD